MIFHRLPNVFLTVAHKKTRPARQTRLSLLSATSLLSALIDGDLTSTCLFFFHRALSGCLALLAAGGKGVARLLRCWNANNVLQYRSSYWCVKG